MKDDGVESNRFGILVGPDLNRRLNRQIDMKFASNQFIFRRRPGDEFFLVAARGDKVTDPVIARLGVPTESCQGPGRGNGTTWPLAQADNLL